MSMFEKILFFLKKIYRFIYNALGVGHYKLAFRSLDVIKKINVKESELYFISSHGIGDVVWAASFFSSYLKKNNFDEKKINIVCCERDKLIFRSYFPNINLLVIKKDELICLPYYKFITKKYNNLIPLIYPKIKKRKEMMRDLSICSEIGMEMDVCYKYGCFDLNEDDIFETPNLSLYESEANNFIHDNNLMIGKTVILVPYINSRLSLPVSEWSKIATKLIGCGYDVYTNVGSSKDKEIEGTKRLFISLEILPLVIKKTGCAISGRCGLGDWIFVNACDLIVIHTYKNGENLNKNEKIQSSFAMKESFLQMKKRCHINGGKLFEYRFNQNGDNSEKIEKIICNIRESM